MLSLDKRKRNSSFVFMVYPFSPFSPIGHGLISLTPLLAN
nr:MAG TPA: hypothetical protein [Caudoviricetes sp.]